MELSEAAVLFESDWSKFTGAILAAASGRERELFAELVRAADLHACFRRGLLETDERAPVRTVLAGVNSSLSPFLPLLERYPDGIPWQPTSQALSNWADGLLYENGVRDVMRRLLRAERYGLTSSRVLAANHIEITRLVDDLERYDRTDNEWLLQRRQSVFNTEAGSIKAAIDGWSNKRIDGYVRVFNKHFIAYDSDDDLLSLYRRDAKLELMKAVETEALPITSKIGPLTFGGWLDHAAAAMARARLHVSFSQRLVKKSKGKLNFRNLLTTPVRHEDLLAVWREHGAEAEHAVRVCAAFRLDAVASDRYADLSDMPLPYYVPFGKYFDLLTHFGYLQNPTAFLISHLRTHYRKDWDRTVGGREAVFAAEFRQTLAGADYVHGETNVLTLGANEPGTTDIDAVVFERSSNTLFLIQLKWPDIVGHSLQERASKLTNLASANEWVSRCHLWASSITRRALWRKFFDSSPPQTFEVALVVIARYMTRFSNPPELDDRATWTSWATFARTLDGIGHQSCAMKTSLARIDEWRPPMRTQEPRVQRYELTGFRIDFLS